MLGLERGYPLTPLLNFTPYAAIASLVLAAALGVLRRMGPAVVCALASFALIAVVVPRALPGGAAADQANGPELRILSANIRRGQADLRSLLELARSEHVDVLAIQELTPDAVAKLKALGVDELLPSHVAAFNPAGPPRGGGIYSRFPLQRRTTVKSDLDLMFLMPRAAFRVPGAPPVEITSVHPQPPTNSRSTPAWKQGLQNLPSAAEAPVRLLAGDFNATLDSAELRDVLDRGYADAADQTGAGLIATWHAGHVWPPWPVTIDHVLVDRRVEVEDVSVRFLPLSDHKAVLAKLVLPDSR